ncbi:MAG: hypothetical protein MR332_12925 [Fusicatenibacter sp.]|nr:hypothetical protein [Fusicatenibacter sp.]
MFRNSCDQALRLFEKAGFPKEKLLMGAAFYSRKWDNVKDRYHGFLQYTEKGGGYGPNYDELAEVKREGIGGIFYWCHSGDESGVLLRTIGLEMGK